LLYPVTLIPKYSRQDYFFDDYRHYYHRPNFETYILPGKREISDIFTSIKASVYLDI
jgi:hypothetical protein